MKTAALLVLCLLSCLIRLFFQKTLDKHANTVYNISCKENYFTVKVGNLSKNLEISVLCDIYGALLPEKQRTALEAYYNEDLSLSEIAEQTGISRQGVRDQIKHAENQLAEFENCLKLREKSKRTEKLLSLVEEIALKENNKELQKIAEELISIND